MAFKDKESKLAYERERYQRNRQKFAEKARKRRERLGNDAIRDALRVWRQSNKDTVNAAQKRRRDGNPLIKVAGRIRCRTRDVLNRSSGKRGRTAEIIGINGDDLRSYIESMFVDGMTWENMSEWEIDHIIPLSAAISHDHLIALCHHTNLQPLWRSENRSKRARIENVPDRLHHLLPGNYPVPAELTDGKMAVGWNTKFTKEDRQLVAELYPARN
jgi:hypothetical protein